VNLARFKHPRHAVVLESRPKYALGKATEFALRKRLDAEHL
jgi:non-ribosomal peptide synthetase component E (peptide arylation enzyme)